MISLRWLAGAGVLVATAVATLALRVPLPPAACIWSAAASCCTTRGSGWSLRWLLRARPEATPAFEALARAQIGFDWLAMAVLIASSGGAESPAIIFFLIHITIASLLLPHHHGFLYVTLAPVLVGAVALLEYTGAVRHVAIVQPVRYREPLYVSAVLGFFTAACYVMAYSCMRIAHRLRRRENELGGLYDGVRDVTSTLDIATVLDRIVEAAARVLTCKAAAIRLIDQNRSLVEFAASWGLSDTYRDEVPGEYAKSVLDQDTLRDGVVHVTDVEHDPRIWHPELVRDERIASMLSVAIKGRTGPMGVLRAYGSPGHEFGAEDIAYLQAVAAHGAVAIENAKAYRLLADLDRDKSKFLRITTHELRSPVRVTESLLMTLGDGFVGTLTPDQTEVLQRAQRRLASLHELIDDLLDLAAGKADMGQVQPKAVDLRAVVSEVGRPAPPRGRGQGPVARLRAARRAPDGVLRPRRPRPHRRQPGGQRREVHGARPRARLARDGRRPRAPRGGRHGNRHSARGPALPVQRVLPGAQRQGRGRIGDRPGAGHRQAARRALRRRDRRRQRGREGHDDDRHASAFAGPARDPGFGVTSPPSPSPRADRSASEGGRVASRSAPRI